MIDWVQLGVGALLGVVIALAAWRVGSLSDSGALAAAFTGLLVFGLGGFGWAVLLLLFFISSSALSRMFKRQKARIEEKFSKGSRRDAGQVLANGGLGALLALIGLGLSWPDWVWVAYAGAMAAVNADTWATELGVLSPQPPRLVTNGRMVERGTSGAISGTGTLAALGGALLIGLGAALFAGGWQVIAAAALGGLMGALFDSLLGATVQAIYTCPTCQKETERHPAHSCGTPTVFLRGWPWMNNDLVNFACSAAGALAALGVWQLLTTL